MHARAKPIMIGRGSAETVDRTGLAKVALAQNRWNLRDDARCVHRANHDNAEGFDLAQWALQTDAADAIAQMAARFAKGEGSRADVVREQQDLLIRRHGEDERLLAAAGRADAKDADEARAAIADIDQKLNAIDDQLKMSSRTTPTSPIRSRFPSMPSRVCCAVTRHLSCLWMCRSSVSCQRRRWSGL